jgi:hypothetical protein
LMFGTALGKGKRENKSEILKATILLCGGAYILIAAPIISTVQSGGQLVSQQLRKIVSASPATTPIAILSVAPEHAFYLLDRSGHPQWSRHYGMWMLPGLLVQQQKPKAEAKRLEELNRVRREFVSDVMCQTPEVIISEEGYLKTKVVTKVDTLGYLKQDAIFASWFDSAYRPAEKFEIFTVWRLKGALPPRGACQRDP